MRLWVLVIQFRCFGEGVQSAVEVSLHLQDSSKLVSGLRKLRIVAQRLIQVFLGVLQAVHANQRYGQIDEGPRRRLKLQSIEINSLVVTLDRFLWLAQIFVAKTKGVVGTRHFWVHLDNFLQS